MEIFQRTDSAVTEQRAEQSLSTWGVPEGDRRGLAPRWTNQRPLSGFALQIPTSLVALTISLQCWPYA